MADTPIKKEPVPSSAGSVKILIAVTAVFGVFPALVIIWPVALTMLFLRWPEDMGLIEIMQQCLAACWVIGGLAPASLLVDMMYKKPLNRFTRISVWPGIIGCCGAMAWLIYERTQEALPQQIYIIGCFVPILVVLVVVPLLYAKR